MNPFDTAWNLLKELDDEDLEKLSPRAMIQKYNESSHTSDLDGLESEEKK